MKDLHFTRTPHMIVVLLTFLPRDSNMKPLYIRSSFKVYRIIKQIDNQKTRAVAKQADSCHPTVDLRGELDNFRTGIASETLTQVKIAWKRWRGRRESSSLKSETPWRVPWSAKGFPSAPGKLHCALCSWNERSVFSMTAGPTAKQVSARPADDSYRCAHVWWARSRRQPDELLPCL